LFKLSCLRGLDFDLPESIGSFRNVDDLLLTLNSLVHVSLSEQIWSGISNEAPFQSLVDKIRAMQEFSSEQKLKRPRNDIFDVVTGTVESSGDEWFDAIICEVMENSDFIDRFVRDTALKRRTPSKKTRKAYENHNRTKDLSNSVCVGIPVFTKRNYRHNRSCMQNSSSPDLPRFLRCRT
jgi:hypothetical protein